MALGQQWLKRTMFSQWLTLTAMIIGTLTAALTFSIGFVVKEPPSIVEIMSPRIDNLESSITRIDSDVSSLKTQIQTLSNIPAQSQIAIQLKRIDNEMGDLKTRHSRLEDVILNNPAKAIEVPLLRKDLDNLKEAQQQNILTLKQGIDQVYDLNKWLLGAMAISIVTLAISNLLKGREREKPAI